MRALLISAALAVSLAACATRPASVAMAPQPEVDAPLSARLFPPQYGQLAVGLNKPAFVAIFEVVPGRGASLVYPTGGTGFTSVLETWVPLRYNPQRWLYASQPLANHAWYRRGSFTYTGGNSGWANAYPASGGPRYFFMIASEDPMAVEQFQGGASSVRRYLKMSYDSYEPYEVMEELAYAVLPYAADERWVTDVVVDWGYDWGHGYGPMAAYSYTRWEPVMCADGSVRMARYVSGWGYQLPCALWGRTAPPVLPIDPNQPGTPGDSVGDGRSRAPAPNEEPRTRQRIGAVATADQDMPDEEVRRRITQLRDDALRTRFTRELDEELRRSVSTRRRIDRLAGRTLSAGDDRSVRTSPSRAADEAYRRAEGTRTRERVARTGQTTRTTAGTPRSRSGRGGFESPPSTSSGSTGSASAGSGSSSGSGERSRAGGSTSSGSSGSSGSGGGRSRIPPA